MQSNNGNYSNINLDNSNINRPSFTVWDSTSLKTLIGGTQQINIYLASITFGEDNTYSAVLNFSIYDDFGVDEGDIANASLAAEFGMEGLISLWVLQHQRGYQPFKTKANFKMTINGKF
jgi:hypothetical protein